MGKSNIPSKEQDIYIAVKLYLERVKTYASSLNEIAAKLHENLKIIPSNGEKEASPFRLKGGANNLHKATKRINKVI